MFWDPDFPLWQYVSIMQVCKFLAHEVFMFLILSLEEVSSKSSRVVLYFLFVQRQKFLFVSLLYTLHMTSVIACHLYLSLYFYYVVPIL